MKAVVLNCSLKPSSSTSNTQLLLDVVIDQLKKHTVTTKLFHIADMNIIPGVTSEAIQPGDEWPEVYSAIVEAEILIIGSPTWLGHPSSLAQKVLERLDGMIGEKKKDGRPLAYDKVAGVVVTGNEDGAHHVISEISGALVDVGFTIPAQAWTYWNMGPGPGPDYSQTTKGHTWSHDTGVVAANNLVSVAKALQQCPISKSS